MADLRQAWQAYHGGNFEEALQLFGTDASVEALAGKALSLLSLRRGDDASAMISAAIQQSRSHELRALLADIEGRKGNRKDAERYIHKAISARRDNGFYRSLLGEQRLRQGKWEEGTNDFIAALNDRNSRTFPHVKRVIADMGDAVKARRIPRPDAMRFINRIDYSISDKSQAMNSFFARARRDLNGNRRIDRSDLVEPWSVSSQSSKATQEANDRAAAASPPPRTQKTTRNSRPSRQPPSNRVKSAGQARNQRNQKRSRPSRAEASPPPNKAQERKKEQQERREKRQDMQNRLSTRPQEMKAKEELLMEARQKDMTAVMQHERSLNESLQDLIEPVHPPLWPSEVKDPIDVVRPIGFSNHAILRGSNAIETANFRITGGDIGVEITLERCMHNLVAATSATKPTTLPLTPPSIPRLELNLLDPFLEAMPDLDKLYREEIEVEDPQTLAIGKFLGECIVQSYGGTWNHEIPVENSVIHLGDSILDPIGMADDFLNSGDFDRVSMRDLIHTADEGIHTSTDFPIFPNYIDPTNGLIGEALAMSLADLWVGYRFMLPDAAIQKIASTIDVIDTNPAYLTFRIDAEYLPGTILGNVDGAIDAEGHARMGYLRGTGEFLVLSSRKHFCRLMEASGRPLTTDVAVAVAEEIQQLFRPGWTVMVDRETTETWQKKSGNSELAPPGIRKTDQHVALRLSAVDGNGQVQRIQLEYRANQAAPYELKVG